MEVLTEVSHCAILHCNRCCDATRNFCTTHFGRLSMQNDFSQFTNDASNANKSLFETVGRLNQTGARTFEKLTSVQMEMNNLLFEGRPSSYRPGATPRITVRFLLRSPG